MNENLAPIPEAAEPAETPEMTETPETPETSEVPETPQPAAYVYTAPTPACAPPKPKTVYSPLEITAAPLALLAGFLIVRLYIYHPAGMLTTLLTWGILALTLGFLRRNDITLRRSDKLWAGVLFVFSAFFALSANTLLHVLMSLFLLAGFGLLLLRLASREADVLRFLPDALAHALLKAPLVHGTDAFSAIASGTKGKGIWKNLGYILGGLVAAVPVTGIAASLLVNADENMSVLMGKLIHMPSAYFLELLPCLFFGILAGAGLYSMLYSAAHRSVVLDESASAAQLEGCRFLPNMLVYAAVTPLCLLYVLFFFSQLQYMTGGFTGDTAGFTYAEYARRGFFELCGVCCLNLTVVAAMSFFSRITGAVKPLALRIYSGFLCISSIVLAGTAIAKMIMYIQIYGMTRLRIYTTWFMVLLVIGFGAIFVRQFLPGLNLGKFLTVVFTVLFGLLCFTCPDAWIVRYNAEMYMSGYLEEFDTEVMDSMSDDAWSALACYSDAELERLDSSGDLSCRVKYHETVKGFWESLNASAIFLHSRQPRTKSG